MLGVAYKAGVGNVRETPASALRSALVSQGCIVEWIDPLVESWENTAPVTADWVCDVAIVVTNQPGISIEKIIQKGTPVLDCTNSFKSIIGVVSL